MSDPTFRSSVKASRSKKENLPESPVAVTAQLGLAVEFDDPATVQAQTGSFSASGKDEMNLAEFPFAVLAKRVAAGQKTIEIIQEGRDAAGRPVWQEWLVTGSDYFGLPVATDDDTYVALMKLLRDAQFRDRTVRFTVSQLLRTMRSSTGKRDYERVAASLDRLTGVLLRSKNAFWDHTRRTYVTEAFHLLDSYRLATGGSGRELSEVTFSQFLFGSIQAGYVKNLDIDFYFSLSTPLARRLYRLLDKHRYRAQVYDISLERLARKLPLQDKYESQIKRRLDPVFSELKQFGFLKEAGYRIGVQGATILHIRFSDRKMTETGGEWEKTEETIAAPSVSAVAGGFSHEDAGDHSPCKGCGAASALVERLIGAGVSRSVAEDLVEKNPGTDVERQLTYLPYVDDLKNPGGYLRLAITEGYGPPPRYSKRESRKYVPKTVSSRVPSISTSAPNSTALTPLPLPDALQTPLEGPDDLLSASAREEIPPDLRPAWDAVLEALSSTTRKPAFETHIRPLMPLRLEWDASEGKGVVLVQTPSAFTYDWVIRHYRDRILQTLQETLSPEGDRSVSVRFLLPQALETP